jgi:hypothetical protein
MFSHCAENFNVSRSLFILVFCGISSSECPIDIILKEEKISGCAKLLGQVQSV